VSELDERCETLAEVCTLATGFAVCLKGMSVTITTARDNARYVAESSADIAQVRG
jgi:hypothetical protein